MAGVRDSGACTRPVCGGRPQGTFTAAIYFYKLSAGTLFHATRQRGYKLPASPANGTSVHCLQQMTTTEAAQKCFGVSRVVTNFDEIPSTSEAARGFVQAVQVKSSIGVALKGVDMWCVVVWCGARIHSTLKTAPSDPLMSSEVCTPSHHVQTNVLVCESLYHNTIATSGLLCYEEVNGMLS